jgi:hypothetical protein
VDETADQDPIASSSGRRGGCSRRLSRHRRQQCHAPGLWSAFKAGFLRPSAPVVTPFAPVVPPVSARHLSCEPAPDALAVTPPTDGSRRILRAAAVELGRSEGSIPSTAPVASPMGRLAVGAARFPGLDDLHVGEQVQRQWLSDLRPYRQVRPCGTLESYR